MNPPASRAYKILGIVESARACKSARVCCLMVVVATRWSANDTIYFDAFQKDVRWCATRSAEHYERI